LENNIAEIATRCYHCGDECTDSTLHLGDKTFCCSGCKLVFELLNENDLCTYYELNNHPGKTQLQPVRKNKFDYLDKEEVFSRLISYSDDQKTYVTFSVPQIHCSSCLWLLEHLNTVHVGVLSTRVNFTKKEVFVVFDNNKTALRGVVEAMSSVGYEPYLSLSDVASNTPKKYNRLTEIAIAGFCFANIMMLSLPEYFSFLGLLEHQVGKAFRYIGFLLALPVFFFCSREFFYNAFSSIKNKYLNIDASVALAILLTFGRSLYNLFVLDGNTYFDSMSGIVFFLLIGRWAQSKTEQSLFFERDYKSFFPIAVNVLRQGKPEPVMIGALQEKDIIEVYDQEIIPADGILAKGKANIDYSFVTGESMPKPVEPGSIIYAGGKQLGERIELMVLKKSDQGYLTNLWNREAKSESDKNLFLHKASNFFTIIVFGLTLISALYWFNKGEYTTMWNALTTTLIVACPCALLLAATFTNGNAMRILNRGGLFLKNAGVIGDLAKVDHIVLDKTGTITLKKNFSINYQGRPISEDEKVLIASLVRHSTHPLSKAVYAQLNISKCIPIESFLNIPGKGIEGWIDNRYIKIGSRQFVASVSMPAGSSNTSYVFIWIDGEEIGFFELENVYRPKLKSMLQNLLKKYPITILSGDSNTEFTRLQGMTNHKAILHFEQSPDDKYNYIQDLQHKGAKVLMVGDGLNDAGALRKSEVGIAVMEKDNPLTPASDGIVKAEKFYNLEAMLSFAGRVGFIINTSFIVSIIYNLIGLFFALQGMLAPVVAAILMPASTISIVLITYLMSEWYGRKFGLN